MLSDHLEFDEKMGALWCDAYSGIISLIRSQNRMNERIVLNRPIDDVIGIYVDLSGTLSFINCNGEVKIAEEYSDYVMFSIYETIHYLLQQTD